ncbi:MarR family winged helix-turn-helix transcriptional regulator [Halomonas sp. HNIBRBA4712]|uniref:MarR family winged helix-turn-helix transcriptional regulator n=1 Tax=Halomonas sp. HNIBRBA4712 TaxID=3373087 RepID=UPI003746CBE1
MYRRYLADPLQQLTHAYRAHMRRTIEAADIGVPAVHVRALKGIADAAPCTAQGLATSLRRDRAQITRMLKDLLDAGLIEKRDHPSDRRSQWLTLTARGEAMLTQVQRLEEAAAARMTEGLSAREVEDFIRLARHMAERLDA